MHKCTQCEAEITGMTLMDGRYYPMRVPFCGFDCMNKFWPKTIFGQAEAEGNPIHGRRKML